MTMPANKPRPVRRWLDRLVRWLRPVQWSENVLITAAGSIYVVRDAPGKERQIRHPWTGEWQDESKVRFSIVPKWESYHRTQYAEALPMPPNALPSATEAPHE